MSESGISGKALGEQMLEAVKAYVGRVAGALSDRLKALEDRLAEISQWMARNEFDERWKQAREAFAEQERAHEEGRSARLKELAKLEAERAVAALPPPKDGEPGTNGKDADMAAIGSAIAFQVQREVAEAVAALPPPKDGDPGKDAEPIHPDTLVLMVRNAVDGALANAVAALPKPRDGDAGRDAFELEILPAIDEAKSYARGTWASHRGGLWKALAQTDGMQGWQIMVDGVAAIGAVEAGDPRYFTLMVSTASGKELKLPFHVPTMIYRGIWQDGEYERGDCVTWGGSMFHCDAEKTTGKPEASPDWKLCAKRGRDGKDFDAPKPGPKQVSLR